MKRAFLKYFKNRFLENSDFFNGETISTYVMRCAIWYHLYNLKNVKNTHGGVLLLALKVTLLHGCFSHFLNCTNGTKSRRASTYYVKIKNGERSLLIRYFFLEEGGLLLEASHCCNLTHYKYYLIQELVE